jgi:autotransporter translocation and assembly factor TamB
VTGTLAVRGTELSGEMDATSPSLALTSTGRLALTARGDGEITFRFRDTTIDPYVRLFAPNLSPIMTAVVSGSVHVTGGLAELDRLFADGTVDDRLSVDVVVDQVDMQILKYSVKNARPIHLVLEERQLRAVDLELVGDETRLIVWGTLGLQDRRVALEVYGEAQLGIIEGFLPDVRGSGYAELNATIRGPLDEPIFLGNLSITNGRIRHLAMPHSFEAINGTIYVDARGIHLDDVTATVADGRVQLGGRIGFDGFVPYDLNVTAHAEDMRLRIPEGVRSTVDADLTLGGTMASPALGGLVTVKDAVWTRRLDAPGSILDLARLRSSNEEAAGPVGAPPALPLKIDVRILAPSTLQVDTNLVRLWADADLALSGTYDQLTLAGHANIERGEVNFEGRRYRVVRGSIDLADSTRSEPFFDVEVETSVRVPPQSGQLSQTYRITVGVVGTRAQFRPTVNSDPPLPTADALALLFGGERRVQDRTQDVELRALQNPNQSQTDILTARLNQAVAAPLSAEVGKVVEQALGVDTFQLSPTFIDLFSQTSRLNSPTARLTIGKRVSDRVFVTFSRSLGTTVNDQIVLLEIEQSERLSWVLSRNEDQQTYALEFRVRRTF